MHGFVTKSENHPPPFSAKRRAPVRGEVRAAYSMMRLEKRKDGEGGGREGGADDGGGHHGDVVTGDRERSDCDPVNRQEVEDVREREGKRKVSDGSGRGRTFGNRRRREGTPDKVRQDDDDGRSNPIPYKVGQLNIKPNLVEQGKLCGGCRDLDELFSWNENNSGMRGCKY